MPGKLDGMLASLLGLPGRGLQPPLPLAPPFPAPAQSIENEVNVYSSYYGLPILSMRSAVYPFILEGREGYQVGVGGVGRGAPKSVPCSFPSSPECNPCASLKHFCAHA